MAYILFQVVVNALLVALTVKNIQAGQTLNACWTVVMLLWCLRYLGNDIDEWVKENFNHQQ